MLRRALQYGGFCFLGAVASYSTIVFLSPEPVTFQTVREVDGVTERGGRIELLFDVRRSKACPVDVERQLWKWTDVDGKRLRYVVPLPHLDVVSGPPSEQQVIVSLPVPDGVEPGQWFYSSRSYSRCPLISWFVHLPPTVSPNVPVTITE